MFLDFSQRASQEELMDDLDIRGPELEGALRSLERVNRLLGGHRLILRGLDELMQKAGQRWCKTHPCRILDLGCGGGDTLRAIARWGEDRGIAMELTGWDANPHTVQYARSRCALDPDIEIHRADVFAEPFPKEVDVVLCSLFLHHFAEPEICQLLAKIQQAGIPYVLINDLHRSPVAYSAFRLFCALFRVPYMARHDGLISIRKGFCRADWEALVPPAEAYAHNLRWQWAFRWQVLLHKTRT
jgi:SAM-dependent methyltransferase